MMRTASVPQNPVHLRVGESEIVARVIRRAVADLRLAPGDAVHAILKAMSVARDQIAGDVTLERSDA